MTKKNLILGSVLIVLIAVAYIYQGPFRNWRANSDKPENFLSAVNIDAISKIEIIKSGETVALEKNGDKLKVSGAGDFYASETVAGNLLKNLKDASEGDLDLVSANKDKKIDFQTDASGISIKIYQADNVVADFIVGKYGNDFASAYVSKADADETYLVKANLASVFNQSEWRDQTILKSDKEKITKINFKYPNLEFTVEKTSDVWNGTAPYKFSVSKEKIDKILDIISNLTAVEIPEQNLEGTDLDKNLTIIQATGEGIDNTLIIGDADKDGDYYVKRGGSDNVYLISKSQRDELDKKISNLK